MKDFFYDDYMGARYDFTESQREEIYMAAEQFKNQHPEMKMTISAPQGPNEHGIYRIYVHGRKRKIPRNSGIS